MGAERVPIVDTVAFRVARRYDLSVSTYEFVLRGGNGRYDQDTTIVLPSVTTIVSAVLAKPQLVPWAYATTLDSLTGLVTQALAAEPSIRQSHWYLGLAYIANGQRQEGVAEIKRALELNYQPQNKTEENFIKNIGL